MLKGGVGRDHTAPVQRLIRAAISPGDRDVTALSRGVPPELVVIGLQDAVSKAAGLWMSVFSGLDGSG